MIKLLLGILFLISPSNKNFDLKVEEYLSERLKGYESFEYEVKNYPKDIIDLQIQNEKEFVLRGSLGYIPITVKKKNNSTFDLMLSVKIKRYAKVLVAVNKISNKSELYSSQFEYKLMDVSDLRGEPITNIYEVSALRSKVSIQKGSVLLKEKTELIPAILSGDKINANSVYGNVTVSTEAFARMDGNIGDVIKIRTKSNKRFKAKIIDSQNVNIIE